MDKHMNAGTQLNALRPRIEKTCHLTIEIDADNAVYLDYKIVKNKAYHVEM